MTVPFKPDLIARLGQARQALSRGDRPGAIVVLEAAARRHRGIADLHVELGNLYLADRRTDEAAGAFRRALAFRPRDAAALAGLGNVCRETGETADAVTAYRDALAIDPSLAAVWFNLGAALREEGSYDDAIAAYDEAIARGMDDPRLRYNRANALSSAGRYRDAIADFDRALLGRPDYADARFSKGLSLLLAGDWAAGWDLNDDRWQARTFGGTLRYPDISLWQGEPLAGRRLLVWREQGVGDEIRYLSVLGEVAAETAAATYRGDRRLRPLVTRAFPDVAWFDDDDPDAPAADVHLPVGSLPRFRRRGLDAFPAPPRPYLFADRAATHRWRDWLATLGAGPKIGISWRTGRNKTRKQARYAPFDAWGRFMAATAARFVCLQYDECSTEVALFRERFGVDVAVPPGLDRRDDFDGQAALYAALDGIITAPNTIGDLAGALGVPTAVVVHAPHWPWGCWPEAGASGQPWYAGLTMIDCRRFGRFDEAFAGAARSLGLDIIPG